MSVDFKIEDHIFKMPDNFWDIKEFIVKSSLKDYKVTVKNDSNISFEIISLINENPNNLLLIDKNVYNLYFSDITIDKSRIFKVNATEDFKTLDGVLKVISFLENKGFTKKETLIIIGGGITQDIGAFVSACFKRGIKWIYFPTTLLSMSDSCIGGKSGINHNNAKNQLGLFYPPYEVIINIHFLKTLSNHDIRSGMGEILKQAIIAGSIPLDIYQQTVKNGNVTNFENYKSLILTSLSVKRAIIETDEFEQYYRKSLNYGHTIGHAIEILTNYAIPHGQAIIIGMLIANKLALDQNILNDKDYKLIQILAKDILKDLSLSEISLNELETLLKKDKKTDGNLINFITIEKPGITKFSKTELNPKLINDIETIFKHSLEENRSSYQI